MISFKRTTMLTLAAALAMGAASSSLVAPDAAQAAEPERKRLSLRQSEERPEEAYRRAAEKKRLESIEFLKDLLAQGDVEGDRKAEMMMRLAELYFDQGRNIYLDEMEDYDKRYNAAFNSDDDSDLRALEKELASGSVNKRSREWQEKSIRLYEQILRQYARYSRADQATYFLGMALQDLNRKDEAARQFMTLVKAYPDSGFVPDAYVNIGEYFFEYKKNAFKALMAYKKATAYRESEKYSFALYKLGWCYYNVGEYGQAIDTMKSVVSYTQTQDGGRNKKLQLQEEALKDLVRFFADAGEMDEAYEYFTKLGKNDLIQAMLKRLGKMYFEQGKYEQAIETYRRLISEDPKAEKAYSYQVEIVNAYRKIGKPQETLQEVDRLLKTYGKNSSWARANASNPDSVQSAQKSLEKELRKTAVEYHTQARKLGKGKEADEQFDLAYKAYTVYLKNFPDDKNAYEIRYAFAELLYKLKKYDEAYDQYIAVVEMDPKGKHSRFCAESAIFAAEEQAKATGSKMSFDATRIKEGEKPTPEELSQWEDRLVKACARYAELFPNDKKVRPIIYKSAYILYNKFRFDEAAEQFNRVIKMDPQSKEAMLAANLMLDSYVVNKNYPALKKNAKFYYDQEGLGTKDFKKDVYGIYQRASFQVIVEDFEQSENKQAAADDYMAYYAEFKDTADLDVLAKALNNASVYYRETNNIVDSINVRLILVEDEQFKAKTKYYYNQIAALGFEYEKVADFGKAAQYYELLFSLYPEEKKKITADKDNGGKDKAAELDAPAADAIYSAAVFRKALGEWETAVDNYTKFLETFPGDERVNDVRLTIAKIYEEQENWEEAAKRYEQFYLKDGKDASLDLNYFARLRWAKISWEHLGNEKDAKRLYQKTVDEYEKYVAKGGEKGPQTEFVAEMMFVLLQPEVDEYMAMGIKSKGGGSRRAEDRAMTKQLKDKQAALQELEKKFGALIQTGSGPWGLAALVQLGKVQENMEQTLLNGDLPFYLDDDQANFYKMGMQDMAYPRKQAAIQMYQLALDKAYELTLYNDDTAYAVRRLGVLAPDDFPEFEEELPTVRLTSEKKRTFDWEDEL